MFSKVVVGVDGRPGGRDAIALAKQLMEPGAHITLVHVYGVNLMLGGGAGLVLAAEREESEQLLTREQADASLDAELMTCASPSVGRGLHELAERHHADLLVVGSCHRGALGRVFLGYDASPESHQALSAARALAAHHGSTIRALSVVSLQSIPYGEPIPLGWPGIAKELVDDELQRFHDIEDVEGDATYGEPSEELARVGDEVDLLIVGSRGYGPVGRLFNGSTSNYLARHARCPLLVLPRSSAVNEEHDDDAGRGWEMPVEAECGAEALR